MWLVNGVTGLFAACQAYGAYTKYSFKTPESWGQVDQSLFENARNFAVQHGIREDVKFLVADLGGDMAVALGNNSILSSDIAIVLGEDYVVTESSPEYLGKAMNVAVRHEFAHLRHNDMFVQSAIKATASIGSAILGMTYFSPLTAFFLTCGTTAASSILYSRFMEARADDEAFEQSSSEELLALGFFMEQEITNNKAFRDTSGLKGKLLVTPEGDKRLFIHYPPATSRLKKLEDTVLLRQQYIRV